MINKKFPLAMDRDDLPLQFQPKEPKYLGNYDVNGEPINQVPDLLLSEEQKAIFNNWFYRPQHIYSIEASKDNGETWFLEAKFKEGDPSRFGDKKMDDELMIKEVESYRQHHEGRRSNLTDVRLIIQMEIKTDAR